MTDGLKGLIVGVANEHSIAWGCAKALREAGAELALTYLNDKAKPHVEPLARSVNAVLFLPLEVTDEAQLAALFETVRARWGRLDFIIHSIAFAPKDDLQGRVADSSRAGFMTAMDVSCHSLIRLAKAAEPLMTEGGAILTMSYLGAEKVVANYNLMGPVKAALESSVRYLAAELGPKGIRVNALSPGPVMTRAASGLSHFDELLRKAAAESPLRRAATIEEIGEVAAFLVSARARLITGQTIYADGGFSITR